MSLDDDLREALAASTVLNQVARDAGVNAHDAQRIIERLVALPDAGLSVLAAAKREQIRMEERLARKAEIRSLAAYRQRTAIAKDDRVELGADVLVELRYRTGVVEKINGAEALVCLDERVGDRSLVWVFTKQLTKLAAPTVGA